MFVSKEKYEHLVELAYHDNLTKCYNRNWYIEHFNDDDEFKFIVIDVNDLKKINDLYGHKAGDKYLCEIVSKLKKFGEVIRFGGDEFILITLINFDIKNIKDSRYCFGWCDKTSAMSKHKVFEIADRYLYVRKDKYHNRIRSKYNG